MNCSDYQPLALRMPHMLYCTLLPPAEILRTLPISSVIGCWDVCLGGSSPLRVASAYPLASIPVWSGATIINAGQLRNILVKFLTDYFHTNRLWRHGLLF